MSRAGLVRTADDRREGVDVQPDPNHLNRTYRTQTSPATSRSDHRSTDMTGLIHEQLARQRHREACLEAHRDRLWRAARAQRRARRAVEVALRAVERAGAESWHRTARATILAER